MFGSLNDAGQNSLVEVNFKVIIKEPDITSYIYSRVHNIHIIISDNILFSQFYVHEFQRVGI